MMPWRKRLPFLRPQSEKREGSSRQAAPTIDPCPQGLVVVAEGVDPVVDIVAVHGLNGHRDKTWTASNNVHWLRDLLSADIPNARILSWGYDANTHSNSRVSCQYLYDHARVLVSDLCLERRLSNTTRRPIIFVAHSLGGIIVKSALIHSDAARQGALEDHRSTKLSTFGIIFMGTPHQGGSTVQLGRLLVNIASVCVAADDRLLRHLERDSEWLQQQLGQYGPISGDFVTKFAYEEYPTRTLLGHSIMVVPRTSAVVPGAADAEHIPIHADHIHMVKFASKQDNGYRTVSGHLRLMVRDAGEVIDKRWGMEIRIKAAKSSSPVPPQQYIGGTSTTNGFREFVGFASNDVYYGTTGAQQPTSVASRPRRGRYTVGWVCALPVELAAAQVLLDEEHHDLPQDVHDTNIYTLGRIGEHNVVLACLPAGQTGTNSVAVGAVQMKSTFPAIRFGLMVGIGGGVPSEGADIRLGDIVVSQPAKGHGGVIQYDFGKSTPSGIELTGFLNAPPRILLTAVSKLQANHDRGKSDLLVHISKLGRLPKFGRDQAGDDVLFEGNYNHIGGNNCMSCDNAKKLQRLARTEDTPEIHYGAIASGNQVMRDAATRDRISSEFGGVLCFEMEAAGLMNNFPCLVIRGICDYADSHKNKRWQAYAAGTAAAYAKELLLVIPAVDVAMTQTVDNTTSGW